MSMDAGQAGLQPARRRVLADEVADSLRNAIVRGTFQSGQRLVEDELASQLSVSRGPVREALARLSQEGLVVLERHRGATVAALSADEVDEIYSLRSALERLAVEWVCRMATDEEFDRIGDILLRFDTLPRPLTRASVAALDVDFHDAIFRAAHHGRLAHAWDALRSQIFLYLIQRGALRSNFAATWRDDHAEFLEVLRSRDVERAVAYADRHIEATYQRVLEAEARKPSAG
jgi:DNA-binding GntR family transcriptional regulator